MPKLTLPESQPDRRPLQVFAFDPMLGKAAGNRVVIEVANERLEPGPLGSRVAVIDYDGANNCYYDPVNLDQPAILMQGGLEPTESDPRFHQQMVYAVAMKVIENFELALGRRITFRRNRRLRLLPHAFRGANAFYDPKLLAILFGYFRAEQGNPGPNLPGQTVFTCLSQDIIAHETTHALVDRLRHLFIDASNRDVPAFHEGFADIVAIFQHFSLPAILRDKIQETRADLRSPTPLVQLAQQFGYTTGQGAALRTAVDKADPKLFETLEEPHERGSILVAAVFDAFFTTYQKRIRDLIRIATGGTGKLPEGDLHPDLVNRIAGEASRTAQAILTMCIRAFDYLPPMDVTFGDYLRALVTADFELNPLDEVGMRAAVIEGFRARGVYPENVVSLAEEALLWDPTEKLENFPVQDLASMMLSAAQQYSRSAVMGPSPTNSPISDETSDQDIGMESFAFSDRALEQAQTDLGDVAVKLKGWAMRNPAVLGLRPPLDSIKVLGFHPVFRVSPKGQLLVEMVAQFGQHDETYKPQFGGVPLRGGATVVASADGQVRYIISKPMPSPTLSQEKQDQARFRIERQREFVARSDRSDPFLSWGDDGYLATRIAQKTNFAMMHQGVLR
jgi:hypothetical protein